jgi:hypothetical protein
MEQLIHVTRQGIAWSVSANNGLEPTLFLSGGRAEDAARRLACGLAIAGCDARVLVRDGDHMLVGTHLYFAG